MKTVLKLFTFISIISLISCSPGRSPELKFSVEPINPKPGDEILIYYNQDSTNLSGLEKIECIAYQYNSDLFKVNDVSLNHSGSIWSGNLKIDKEAYGIILKFKSDDETDNNNKSGYVVYLTGEDDKKIAGSDAGYAAAINRWGAFYLDLDRDREKALSLFNEEFEKNPQVKEQFLNSYFEVVSSVEPEKKNEIIMTGLENPAKKNSLNEKELELLTTWYKKIGDTTKSGKFSEELNSRFPQNKLIQSDLYVQFRNEKDVKIKLELLKKFEAEFPGSEYTSVMYDLVANAYRDVGNYSDAYNFLNSNKDKMSVYRFYAVADRMIDENKQPDIAEKIALLGVKRGRSELAIPSERKPDYYSDNEWKKEREYYLALNLFTYGKILYNLEKKSECLPVIEEAVRLTESKDGEMNELYSKALIENGKYEKAMDEISSFIKSGNSTASMKSLLKEAYLNKNGSEEGFDNYIANYENAAKEKLVEELKSKMIFESAPDFTLSDLNGKQVSLANYKGKIVVLDFWATWCGPCLASFPGMKDAVEKFKNDNKVSFLFIDSWERVDNKESNARQFIEKNNYPFHVLLDDKNEVIEKYKVSGIPTKFVVDAGGNIRFMNVGFEGTSDQLVEEISSMISLVQ